MSQSDDFKEGAEAQAPQTEATPDPVKLDEPTLEQLLIGCIWDVLRRMRRVSMHELTPDQATEEDDAVARHLARTLMGENPGFTMALPMCGPTLIDHLRATVPAYAAEQLPDDIDRANPRAVAVYVCRDFLRAIYNMVRDLSQHPEMTRAMLDQGVNATAAFWAARLAGRSTTLN